MHFNYGWSSSGESGSGTVDATVIVGGGKIKYANNFTSGSYRCSYQGHSITDNTISISYWCFYAPDQCTGTLTATYDYETESFFLTTPIHFSESPRLNIGSMSFEDITDTLS